MSLRVSAALFGPVLAPDGADARADAPMAWLLLGGGIVLFVAVMLLLALALAQPGRPVRPRRWIVGGGLLLPTVVLGALYLANLQSMASLDRAPPAGALRLGVKAKLWWWELRLPNPAGGPDVLLANELRLPVGQPVWLTLASDELIHSLWVPALAGKIDLLPGHVTHLRLQAERAGQWRGPCAEFCGSGHARMVLQVVGVAPAEFEAWRAQQLQPARPPVSALQQLGQQHFLALRCNACHRIRGFVEPEAAGPEAPDLTHLASRAFIGSGALANDAAGLRAWITDNQRIKPGALMPQYRHLDAATLEALVAYLGSLQ